MGSLASRVRASRPEVLRRPTAAEVAHGGPVFRRGSVFVRARAAGRPTSDVDLDEVAPPSGAGGWRADLGGVVALVRLAAALPALDVRLSSTPAGDALRTALAGRTLGVPRNRLCAAVLQVPAQVAERPSGKRHQALRTALTASARAGLEVRLVPDAAERRTVADAAARRVPRLASWARSAPGHTEQEWWVASGPDGTVAGIATVVVDAEWASLVILIGLPGGGTESHARFLLHHAVVRSLAARGVRWLTVLDRSPLLLAPGPQHLQRVLGYQVARLRRPTRA